MVVLVGTPKLVACSRKSLELLDEVAEDERLWSSAPYRLVHLSVDVEDDQGFWLSECGNSEHGVCVGSTALFMRQNNKRLVFQGSGGDSDLLKGPFTKKQLQAVIQAAMDQTDGIVVLPANFEDKNDTSPDPFNAMF
eukprot:TRINITY_DN2458_c0_g1_i4.p1 TRINITY_DN2458_c0_g1~~TRINITY_DN2458_c0_g1_i4.p1  ORF type:complete len:137 (-),score=48.62 TRINITY_DN2458_c0_g1_i4:7-417(-)